jgi:hypothetical protein
VNQAFISFDHAMIGTVMIQEGEKGRRTYFWTKGKINGKEVIIYAGIAGSVTSNRDIPKFIRQVIQFNH